MDKEIYSLLYTCTDPQIKREVEEDILYLAKYIPNPSPSFLNGLKDKLKKHQPKTENR
jgi:hypothetical protein